MGRGLSYRDPLGYSFATVAVAAWADNDRVEEFLAGLGLGYTEVSDAALDTIRRNKAVEINEIRETLCKELLVEVQPDAIESADAHSL